MATKNVHSVVSGAGFTADFWVRWVKAIRARGGTDDDVYAIGADEFIEKMANEAMATKAQAIIDPQAEIKHLAAGAGLQLSLGSVIDSDLPDPEISTARLSSFLSSETRVRPPRKLS